VAQKSPLRPTNCVARAQLLNHNSVLVRTLWARQKRGFLETFKIAAEGEISMFYVGLLCGHSVSCRYGLAQTDSVDGYFGKLLSRCCRNEPSNSRSRSARLETFCLRAGAANEEWKMWSVTRWGWKANRVGCLGRFR
jgi:hypothetical protein